MSLQSKASKALLSPHDSEEGALALADIASQLGLHVHGAIVAFAGDFTALKERLSDGRSSLRGITLRDGAIPAVEVIRRMRRPSKRLRTATVIMIAHPDTQLLYLLSVNRREDFDFAVDAVLDHLWHDTSRVYFRTPHVSRALADIFEWPTVTRLRVLEYTSRTVREDEGIRRKLETERHWANLSVDEAFQRLASGGQWLTSILFSIRHKDNGIRVRMLRNASFTCNVGFLPFWDAIRPLFASIILDTHRFFQKRDKDTSPTGHVRPLRIGYSEPVFADKHSNRRLVEALRSLSATSVSVWHPNPYLHASVLDYIDGSSCDVLVAHDDSIIVVPQHRASSASLERICNHICDQFQEGKIVDS